VAVAPGPSHGAVLRHRRRRLDVRIAPRRRSRLRLRDWRMRSKLAAVLAVPSVAFLVVAGIQTATLVNQADLLDEFADQVRAGREITALVHELQRERDQTAGELAALGATPGGVEPGQALPALKPAYSASDRAITRFREVAAPLGHGTVSWRISYERANEAVKNVLEARSSAPAAGTTPGPVLAEYDRAIEALLVLLAEPSPGTDRPELTDAVQRYVEFAWVKEINSRIRGELYAAARTGRFDSGTMVRLADLRTRQLGEIASFRLSATDEQIERYAAVAADPTFVAAAKMEESTIAAGARGAVLPEPAEWWAASLQRQELLRQVEAATLDDAIRAADASSAAQLRRTLLSAGGVLGVLLAALLTSVVISRSIVRSLRMLRNQALRVAQIELPETLERLRTADPATTTIDVPPADVRSTDEIGEVAEAFVAVHRSAVSLALEQATMRRHVNAMFVNLARRSQVLVDRQLELLDELEREESDPDQLANLFKLDHLAARMRRNDDSLLVLAGSEPTRRWSRPVSLATVILAAVAEIEQYQRVRHDTDDTLYVVGHSVADLVHLLAELLENATAFSRPETTVQVRTTAQPDGGVLLDIVDEGLGMSPKALQEANGVLEEPPAADVAASERMGLFVVSHLAARQGVRVRLEPTGRGGLVAHVLLPASLLTAPPPPTAKLERGPERRMVTAGTAVARRDAVRPPAAPASAPASGPKDADGGPAGRTVRRENPTRAEDVLGAAGGEQERPSTWWSRPGPRPASGAAAGRTGAADGPPSVPAGGPPAVPVIGGINSRGLPIRVPMAQLPGSTGSARPRVPVQREEPDPEQVGGMLARYYGGIRRAEAEDTMVIPVAPAGAGSEEEK